MTIKELADKLQQMYTNAPKGEKVAMIHLFGIVYATEIQKCGFSKKEIAESAKISNKYGTEINKGVKLSKYVLVKNQ